MCQTTLETSKNFHNDPGVTDEQQSGSHGVSGTEAQQGSSDEEDCDENTPEEWCVFPKVGYPRYLLHSGPRGRWSKFAFDDEVGDVVPVLFCESGPMSAGDVSLGEGWGLKLKAVMTGAS